MTEGNSRWNRVLDRAKWDARGASFVAKAKATKVVWFPPKPMEAGKKTASTAKRATARVSKKTTGTATKATKATANATSPGRPKKI